MSKNYSRREVIGTLGATALATSVASANAEVVSPPQVRRVVRYRLGWHNAQRTGMVVLVLENPAPAVTLRVASPQDFAAFLAVLKEEPVFYSSNGWLRTGAEEIG